MYERALAGFEKVLGPEHPFTLTMVDNLWDFYSRQGRLEDAEKMFRRAEAGKKRHLRRS